MKLSENNIGQIWQEHSNKHPPQLQSTDFLKKYRVQREGEKQHHCVQIYHGVIIKSNPSASFLAKIKQRSPNDWRLDTVSYWTV
jgi:hypothetical protein